MRLRANGLRISADGVLGPSYALSARIVHRNSILRHVMLAFVLMSSSTGPVLPPPPHAPAAARARREARGPLEGLSPGSSRDQVALLVASPTSGLAHRRFCDIGDYLERGDVVVVNDSATLPAALPIECASQSLRVHLSSVVAGSTRRLVEFRTPTGLGSAPCAPPPEGTQLALPSGGTLTVASGPLSLVRDRLREAELDLPDALESYLTAWGEPIRYPYVAEAWPLSAYQTIFARVPGSSEMPSAGRPFSTSLVAQLETSGVTIVPITLHTAVASHERGETPSAEAFRVSATTAVALNAARQAGKRIIATGTSVVRALESCLDESGQFHRRRAMTELVIEPSHSVRSVDGLITGWHDEDASHLHMLEAIAGTQLLSDSYAAARRNGYLWHEFGDSNLILRW